MYYAYYSKGLLIVHVPESETLPPPPRGFLKTCIISKLHPRVFEKCMFAFDWLVSVAVQQHSFLQQRVTGYPHQEVSLPLLKHHYRQKVT